jgi:photosystem II stability/assembly factor-like uncharacterized protein
MKGRKIFFLLLFHVLLFSASCKKKYVEVVDTIRLEHQSSPTTKDLHSIWFLSATNGFIGGSSGVIYKTLDGGKTWVDISLTTADDVSKIYFFDDNKGFAGTNSGLYKTVDGGGNWALDVNIYHKINDICFYNNSVGYAAGGENFARMYKTTNGGQTWTDKTNALPGEDPINRINFINKDTGFAVESNGQTCMRTTDGADNWQTIKSGSYSLSFNDVYFTSFKNGYVVGDEGMIINPLDALTDYSQIRIYSYNLYAVDIINNEKAVVVGENSIIIPSTYNIQTSNKEWKYMVGPDATTIPYTYYDVEFIDNNVFFAVGKGGVITKFYYPQ